METQLVVTTGKELKNLVKEAIIEVRTEEERKLRGQKTFTINQIAKRLGKSHATIKKYCKAGIIATTASGLITEKAIDQYLSKQ